MTEEQGALELWKEWFLEGGDPFLASEAGGDVYCFFCGEWQQDPNNNPTHADRCLYVRAKALVERAFPLHGVGETAVNHTE